MQTRLQRSARCIQPVLILRICLLTLASFRKRVRFGRPEHLPAATELLSALMHMYWVRFHSLTVFFHSAPCVVRPRLWEANSSSLASSLPGASPDLPGLVRPVVGDLTLAPRTDEALIPASIPGFQLALSLDSPSDC